MKDIFSINQLILNSAYLQTEHLKAGKVISFKNTHEKVLKFGY